MNLSKQVTTLAVLLGGLTTALSQTIDVSGHITNNTAWTKHRCHIHSRGRLVG